MTATRNGRFRRAAMRAMTVAGFAAAAWFAGSAVAHDAEQPETQSEPAAAFGEAHAAGGPAQGAPNTGEDRVATAHPPTRLPSVTTLLRAAPELDVQQVVTGVDAVLAVPGQLLHRPWPDDPDDPNAPARPREQQPKPNPGPRATCGEHDPLLALVKQILQPARHTVTAVAGPAIAAVPVGMLPDPVAAPVPLTVAARSQAVHIAPSTVVRTKQWPGQPQAAADHIPFDGDGSGRTPDLNDCSPSTVPASSNHGGDGASAATLTAMAVLIEPRALASRRVAESALRRADTPRPTGSPD
jgi:hypothetical protein